MDFVLGRGLILQWRRRRRIQRWWWFVGWWRRIGKLVASRTKNEGGTITHRPTLKGPRGLAESAVAKRLDAKLDAVRVFQEEAVVGEPVGDVLGVEASAEQEPRPAWEAEA